MTSIISIRNAKSGENCVLPGTIFKNYFCIPEICQKHRETTIIDIAIAKEFENIPFI